MILKRTIKVSLIVVLSFLFIGLTALSGFFLFVPHYAESEIIPSIAKDNGIEISSLKVRSIGLNGAEISDVKIGSDNDKNLTIDSIRVDYSISGLLDRQIDRIALSGINVNLEYKNNIISVGGLDSLISAKKNSTEKDSNLSEPFTVNSLSVTNSILQLHVNGKRLIVPFDFSATAFDQNKLPKQFRLEIFPGGYKATVEGDIDNQKDVKLRLISHSLSLNIFEDIINDTVPLDIRGQADIELSATLSQEPVSLTDLSASLMLKEIKIDSPGIKIKNSVNSDSSEEPITIKINSKDLSHFEYDISPLLLDAGPAPVMLEISGTADLSENIQKGNIKAITRIMSGGDLTEMRWDVSASRQTDADKYKVVINGGQNTTAEKHIPITAHFEDIPVTIFSPELNVKAEYDRGSVSGSYLINIKNIKSQYNESSFSMPMVSIKGNFKQSEDKPGKYMATFLMESKDTGYRDHEITMSLPDYRIKGSIQYDKEKEIKTDARISFNNGTLSMPRNLLNINKISANMPFSWPADGSSRKGKLVIGKITYENYSVGPVNIDIRQKGSDIPFSGSVIFPALPEMAIKVSGNTALEPMTDQVKMRIEVPSYNPASGIDLGKFSAALKGFYYKGSLSGKADINYSNSNFLSGLNIEIGNGSVENNEKNLYLKKLSLALTLDDLLKVKSPFGQRLKIGEVSFGKVSVNDLKVDFRVDGPSSLFIEQGSFKWCGGTINIQSFRIDTKKDEYLLTLFCDRLRLADLLEQFGVEGVSGGGTVNGKIPVTISKGKIRFEDGFLYSTPGGGGKIKIKNTEIFKSGMTPGSPEYTQVDIASEALKAYDYSWVKMAINSEKDELTVKLQFDGKPENQLPFRYDKDLNRFKRVEKGVPGANFQGISIDVNFRVPLDELLNYKGALDMISN